MDKPKCCSHNITNAKEFTSVTELKKLKENQINTKNLASSVSDIGKSCVHLNNWLVREGSLST